MKYPTTKPIKDSIRKAIGQTSVFVIRGDSTACPVCSGADLYDSVNELSLDPFCTVCSGSYWFVGTSELPITAHVRQRTGDESDWGIAGEVVIGDCIITIDIDELSDSQIVRIKEIRVDGNKFSILRTIKRGVPERDRIRFACRQVGKE